MAKKLLLVEDEAPIALKETQMLEKHGYEVVTAYSGKGAIELVDSDPHIALILMDIVLQHGLDGAETAQRILWKHNLPIIFLSFYTELEVVERTKGITSYGYLLKGSGETVILATIRMALDLFEAHSRVNDLYENAPCGYHSIDREGIFVRINNTELSWLGYTRSELIEKKKFSDLITTESLETFEKNFPVFKDRGYVQDLEFEMICKDGTTFPVLLNATAVKDSAGDYLMSRSTIIDITERRKAEEELRRKEDLLNYTQQLAHIGGWEWNVETQTMTWTDETYRIHGMTPGELAPGTSEHINLSLGCYDPADRTVIENAFDSCAEDGQPYDLELPLTRIDGSRIWIRTMAYAEKQGDRVVRVFGNIMDITKRKQAEIYRDMGREILQILNEPGDLRESIQRVLDTLKTRTGVDAVGMRLQEGEDFPYFVQDGFSKDFLLTENTLLERCKDGGVCRDKDGNVRLECTCGLVISGKTDPSKPFFTRGGSSWTNDSFPLLDLPSDQDPRLNPRNNCIHQGYASVALIPVRTTDRIVGLIQLNDKRKGRFTLERIEILEGIAAHIGSALIRKQAEEEIQKQLSEIMRLKSESDAAREEVEEASRAKSAFLSSMSHELRTPLNAILGFSQLLNNDEELSAQQQEFAGEIFSAGNHLLSLINEVLDLARIESGRIHLSMEPVSCAVVLSESAKMIGPFADKHGIRLEIGKADGLSMRADAVRVKQVLVNLLSNAIKYNKPGGLVTVVCSRRDDTVRISVTDTGEGIPREKIGELFKHFSRLGRETGDIEGTGIGLAHSKRLVELMDGSIGVESVDGEGSTFWIEVPASEESAQSFKGKAAAPEGKAGAGVAGQKQITVLYIEDNPAAIRLMEHMLFTRERYRLITAHTGSLGLEMAKAEHPEVMLVDINLPGIDGYEVLRRVRESEWGRETPVIAVSANAMERAVKRGEDAGFTAYVTKPFDVADFLATLDKITYGQAGGEKGGAR